MMEKKVLLRFFDKGFLLKYFYILLLYSLFPLVDIYLLLYLKPLFGAYILIAAAAVTGLFGLILAYRLSSVTLSDMSKKLREGIYPTREFNELAGIIISAIFLLTPGFVTDFLGLLMIFPFWRNLIGKMITKYVQEELKEISEYLKMYEF